MRTLKLITISLLIYSCQAPTYNPDILLAENADTLKVTKRYVSKAIMEIITYKANKPFKNIGFTEQGDSLKQPTLIYTSTDNLFVFIPLNKFKTTDLYFGFDSARAVNGKQPKFRIKDLKSSSIIELKQDMIDEPDKIVGAIKCWDSINNSFNFYPFRIKTK